MKGKERRKDEWQFVCSAPELVLVFAFRLAAGLRAAAAAAKIERGILAFLPRCTRTTPTYALYKFGFLPPRRCHYTHSQGGRHRQPSISLLSFCTTTTDRAATRRCSRPTRGVRRCWASQTEKAARGDEDGQRERETMGDMNMVTNGFSRGEREEQEGKNLCFAVASNRPRRSVHSSSSSLKTRPSLVPPICRSLNRRPRGQ